MIVSLTNHQILYDFQTELKKQEWADFFHKNQTHAATATGLETPCVCACTTEIFLRCDESAKTEPSLETLQMLMPLDSAALSLDKDFTLTGINTL